MTGLPSLRSGDPEQGDFRNVESIIRLWRLLFYFLPALTSKLDGLPENKKGSANAEPFSVLSM